MEKCDVLGLLGLFVGGLLSLGDGAVVGVPLVVASAYCLFGREATLIRERMTAVAGGRPR